MIRVCNFNKAHENDLIMGEKAPFENKSKTHGMCEECCEIIIKEYNHKAGDCLRKEN